MKKNLLRERGGGYLVIQCIQNSLPNPGPRILNVVNMICLENMEYTVVTFLQLLFIWCNYVFEIFVLNTSVMGKFDMKFSLSN